MSRLVPALAVLGALSILVPYAADGLGMDIGVDATTEVIDHVVPGIAAVGGAYALRGAPAGSPRAVAASALALLAGLLALVSHLPLLAAAGTPPVAWGEAIFHSLPGPPLAVVGGLLFAREVRRL